MAKWIPGKVIERHARRLQQQVARAIRAAAPRVAHRGGAADAAGSTGGTLSQAVLAKDVLVVKRWGAVLRWSTLGQKFLWFTEGTKRQKARPVPLTPDVAALRRDLEDDAARHYARAQARAR